MADGLFLPTVHCDIQKWVRIPIRWGGRSPNAQQWADAEAERRWQMWGVQHPDAKPPTPEAIGRTALQLKSYADKYVGGGAGSSDQNLTYLYLPDPAGSGFPMHVAVDDKSGLTVETAMAEPDAAEAEAVRDFTTDKLGTGRKFTMHGTLDDGPGGFFTVAYIFNVPGHPGVALMRATDTGPEQISVADSDLDEFVRSITVTSTNDYQSWLDPAFGKNDDDSIPDRPYSPVVYCDTRKWKRVDSSAAKHDLTYRYLSGPTEPSVLVRVGMDRRPTVTVESITRELETQGTAVKTEYTTKLGTARKVKQSGSVAYLFAWPDQGVIYVRATDDDPQRLDAADADLEEFVRCMTISTTDPSVPSPPPVLHSRDLDRMGHLGKTTGEDGHSYFGTPLTQILHASVQCDHAMWLQVPLEWDEHYPSPPQWADGWAEERWDAWAAAHPGTSQPSPEAVQQTAQDLQKVAEYYGGFDEFDPYERLNYVYLPDPSRHGITLQVAVSDSEYHTVEKYLAGIDPTDQNKSTTSSFHNQLDPGATPVSESFTTEALGEGRKITARGTADARLSDPPGPPGVWAETRYAFAVPNRRDVVEVSARSTDPASLTAAAADLDEFVRGITIKTAPLPDMPAGHYDVDALALLRAVHDRRKLQTVLRECVGLWVLWLALAIAVHAWVPGRYNLHHRMDHDAVVGMVVLGVIALVPAVRLFVDRIRDPLGAAAAALVSGTEPKVVQEDEYDIYGPEVARGLVPLLRRKPLYSLGTLGMGVGALPMIVMGALAVSDAPGVGIFFLAIGAFSLYNTVGLIRFFADSERYIQSTTADASLPDSVAALASGRRIVIDLEPKPGRITLGLPPDATVPEPDARPSRATLVGVGALTVVVLLGFGVRYSGHYDEPGKAIAVAADTGPANPGSSGAQSILPPARHVQLNYLRAAGWESDVEIRDSNLAGVEVEFALHRLGIQTPTFGPGWTARFASAPSAPAVGGDPAGDFLSVSIDVFDIGSTSCAQAIKAAIDPPGVAASTPTSMSGLPVGWSGGTLEDPVFPKVVFAGCRAGMFINATVSGNFHHSAGDMVPNVKRLVAAISQRGIAKFRADTAP